LLRNSEKEH